MNLPPVLRQRYFDANGNPLAGGKLYTYQAGTTTPQVTYTDSGGQTPNTNPIVLDANGEASMWLDPALSYKFVLKDSNDVVQWTQDNVVGFLTANSVVTASIMDGAVTTQKIADSSITSAKIQSSASTDADRPITADHIRNNSIVAGKIANDAITAASQLAAAVREYLVPTGAFFPFGGVVAPAGFLLCDGSAVSRVTYAALFAAIGTAHGDGTKNSDGSNSIYQSGDGFNLPDYRDRFVRGVGNGVGRDPDSASRTAMNVGGNVGDAVGSIQDDQNKSHNHGGGAHTHFVHTKGGTLINGGATPPGGDGGGSDSGRSTDSSGSFIPMEGTESRPKNGAANFIIKT